MKQIFGLAFCLFLLPFFSVAQSNYKPGYVVSIKGDTIRGFIDLREWDSNPNAINFKTQLSESKGKSFTPADINSFTIDGLETYQRYSGPISMDAIDQTHISEGKDTSFKTATVFLKLLQHGDRVVLYSYSDNLKTRFYIEEKNDESPKELIYRVYFDMGHVNNLTRDGKTVEDNIYLKQLFALAQRYNVLNDSFQWDIDHASYNKQDILKLVTKINGLSKAEYTKQNYSKKAINFFAGIALNAATTNPASYYQDAGGKSYTSYLPAIMAGINLLVNPNTGKLVFRAELIAAENKYTSNYVDKNAPYVPIMYAYNQLAISIVPQVIYNFYNAENFKVYAGVGLVFGFYSYSNASFGSTDGKTPTAQIVQNDPYDFNKSSTPVMFKAGVQLNKNFGFFADYITASSVSHDSYFQLNFSAVQAGINYFF